MILRWDAPGPYAVGFTTRRGGVSTGPYASLNLGRRTGDDVERVDENRAIACSELGADAERIAAAVTVAPRIVERLDADALTPAEVVGLAEPWAPDAPLFALAVHDRPELRDYFRRLGGVHLAISGGDLAELGLAESPRVGEVLAELRRRKLNGELEGREAEIEAARELIG